MNAIQKIWYKIYPSTDEHKWFPVVWLPFMIWFFIDPIWWQHRTPLLVIGNTLFGLFFIWLYLYSFSHPEPHQLYATLGLLMMAACLVPTHNGAVSVLFVYAIAPGAATTNRPRLISFLGIALGLMGIYSYHLKLPLAAWGSMVLLIILVGIVNHLGAIAHCRGEQLRKADAEIEHLAKVAERERIARDMHDLLGHTLSLITLKAELARKLVDRDPQRAKEEMLDVERTSRAALADVRQAISGYRGEGLAAELVRARKTLETAGVSVDSEIAELPLSPAQETVLALALREAVTNVVRHAQAQQCSVRLQREEDLCTLEIADNGRGADAPEGNGLRGMRERLEALGGSLQCRTEAGTHLVMQLPLGHPIAPTAGALGTPVATAAPALRN
jgi:two-component system, NarL family, sensor histidine kinase DesK